MATLTLVGGEFTKEMSAKEPRNGSVQPCSKMAQVNGQFMKSWLSNKVLMSRGISTLGAPSSNPWIKSGIVPGEILPH